MMELISIARIKWFKSLERKKGRAETGAFPVEGIKTYETMLQLGCRPLWTAALPEIYDQLKRMPEGDCFELNSKLAERLSFLQTPPGLAAVFPIPQVADFPEPDFPCMVIADGISDPGNLGTLIRTMHWFGIRHIWLSEGAADVFHPKTVQASMGSIAAMSVYVNTPQEMKKWLEKHKIEPSVLRLGAGSQSLPRNARVWVLGSEARGVSETFQHFGEGIELPAIDSQPPESLNVSICFAALMGALHWHAG